MPLCTRSLFVMNSQQLIVITHLVILTHSRLVTTEIIPLFDYAFALNAALYVLYGTLQGQSVREHVVSYFYVYHDRSPFTIYQVLIDELHIILSGCQHFL